MSNISAYEEALQTIARVENENLLEVATIMDSLRDAVSVASSALTAKRNELPNVPGSVTTVRSSLDSWMSQVQGFLFQAEQISIQIKNNLNVYNPENIDTAQYAPKI